MSDVLDLANIVVVVMANDDVYPMFLSFIESFRNFNEALRLEVIPYNDNMDKIKKFSKIYNFKIIDYDFTRIDEIAQKFFPNVAHRNRLRKIAAFQQEGQIVIYIDIDVVVFSQLEDFALAFKNSNFDLSYITVSSDSVYKGDWGQDERLGKTHLFSSGFLAVKTSKISLEKIVACLEKDEHSYRKYRVDNLIDQPILNFYADTNNLRMARIDEILPAMAPHCWFLDKQIKVTGNEANLIDGRQVPIVHWAGNNKTDNNANELNKYRARLQLSALRKISKSIAFDSSYFFSPGYSFTHGGKAITDQHYTKDYIQTLIRLVFKHIPVLTTGRFLEWGSGVSTLAFEDMLEVLGGNLLLSYDSNSAYSQSVSNALCCKLTTMKVADLTGQCSTSDNDDLNYSTAPLSEYDDYDLIFIDGRRRMECLFSSLLLCHDRTIIILSAFKRKRYQLALAYCDAVEESSIFRVMRPKKNLLKLLRKFKKGIANIYKN